MPLFFERLFRPALVIGLILIALALAIVLAMLAGGPPDDGLLGPFRWMGTGAKVA